MMSIAVHMRGRRECSDNPGALFKRVLDAESPRGSDGFGDEALCLGQWVEEVLPWPWDNNVVTIG